MSPGADLFVVCKQCGSEVSPYITECPYCGHRLRRRAPKLPREGESSRPRRGVLGRLGSRSGADGESRAPAPERARRRRRPSLPLTGAVGTRPYVTIALVAVSCVAWVLLRADYIRFDRPIIFGALHGDWWKLLSTQFSYLNGWYAFVTLLVIAIFGWLLERATARPSCSRCSSAPAWRERSSRVAVYPLPVIVGGNAGALALIAAWAAPDLRDARSGDYYEGDLLGAGALAALLLAIPFARPEASWLAGVVGAAIGLLVGLGLPRAEHARM